MKLPAVLWGLTAQLPFLSLAPEKNNMAAIQSKSEFAFKEGANVFSPKDLIELIRPGVAAANPAGDLAVVQASKYSFQDKTGSNQKSFYIVPLNSEVQPLHVPLVKEGDIFWLADRTVAHVFEEDEDLEIWSINILFSDGKIKTEDPKLIGTFPVKTATNFRYHPQSQHLVFSAKVYPDANLTSIKIQDEEHEARGNSAYVYDSGFPRHWDTWIGPKKNQLFSVHLSQGSDKQWTLSSQFNSLLKDTGHHSPVEPFGGTDDFDVSSTNIVYTTKDPQVPEPWSTKQNVYVVDIQGKQKPRELTSGKHGATHNPVFNTAGTKVAWLELRENGYESDRAKVVIYDLQKNVRFTLTQHWDYSPSSVVFSREDDFLFFVAEDQAKGKIFALPVPPTPEHSSDDPKLDAIYTTPFALTSSHTASGIQALPSGKVLFSQSSLSSPNDVFVMRNIDKHSLTGNVSTLDHIKKVTSFAEEGLKGKDLGDGDEFWFKGANDRSVQGFILKPKGWKDGDKKKWPVILFIHGGPQSAWKDEWSTRWNGNVFAQQGYFVVMINPTGSTGFGQDFTDGIALDWGGKPFVDLIAGWKHVLATNPTIDADRAAAAGASWGGYAINWIQGHPEYGFNFKALVCHDGVFDTEYDGYSTDELFFPNHEWGGRPWETRELYNKYNPTSFVSKWSTPQLLIHGSKDYRIPESDGIGAFNALQQLGVPSRLVIFPDENHWVLNHGNSLKWHYEVLRWINQYVGDKE